MHPALARRVGAALPLALALAFAVAAWRIGASIGDVAAQHAWRAAWTLVVAALVVALAPRLGGAAVGGAYVGGAAWVIIGYATRQPWPDSFAGVVLNLALVATSPMDALRDVPWGLVLVLGGAIVLPVGVLIAARRARRGAT